MIHCPSKRWRVKPPAYGRGLRVCPPTLDPAFQKDGLNVQFSATVIDNGVGGADGTGGGVYITITSIHVR